MENKIIIGCDGGCRGNQFKENIGGYGVVLRFNGNEKLIKGGELNTTNNRMELMACIVGMESLKKKDVPVEVYTDSAYLHSCINAKWYVNWEKNGWLNGKKKPVENKDLWVRILALIRSFNNITFHKSKGHSGDELNELADALANEGMDELKTGGRV